MLRELGCAASGLLFLTGCTTSDPVFVALDQAWIDYTTCMFGDGLALGETPSDVLRVRDLEPQLAGSGRSAGGDGSDRRCDAQWSAFEGKLGAIPEGVLRRRFSSVATSAQAWSADRHGFDGGALLAQLMQDAVSAGLRAVSVLDAERARARPSIPSLGRELVQTKSHFARAAPIPDGRFVLHDEPHPLHCTLSGDRFACLALPGAWSILAEPISRAPGITSEYVANYSETPDRNGVFDLAGKRVLPAPFGLRSHLIGDSAAIAFDEHGVREERGLSLLHASIGNLDSKLLVPPRSAGSTGAFLWQSWQVGSSALLATGVDNTANTLRLVDASDVEHLAWTDLGGVPGVRRVGGCQASHTQAVFMRWWNDTDDLQKVGLGVLVKVGDRPWSTLHRVDLELPDAGMSLNDWPWGSWDCDESRVRFTFIGIGDQVGELSCDAETCSVRRSERIVGGGETRGVGVAHVAGKTLVVRQTKNAIVFRTATIDQLHATREQLLAVDGSHGGADGYMKLQQVFAHGDDGYVLFRYDDSLRGFRIDASGVVTPLQP